MLKKVNDSVAFIQQHTAVKPLAGIVLGSGLGDLISDIKVEDQIPYKNIPHFPVSTVEGHKGSLILGRLDGVPVVAMSGRFHNYEGYAAQEIVFPIRVLKFLGVKYLLLSNAAGATNHDYKVGDLMIINDHISFFVNNPLTGKNLDELGPRFPDMSAPYDPDLIRKAKKIAAQQHIALQEGVYVSVPGPTFETRAEYKMIMKTGGDAVGMSTVQEVIAARHMGLKCFAVSVITDLGIRESAVTTTHEEVLKAAREAEPKLSLIFGGIISQLQ